MSGCILQLNLELRAKAETAEVFFFSFYYYYFFHLLLKVFLLFLELDTERGVVRLNQHSVNPVTFFILRFQSTA